ncbi:MAG: aminotransferase class I/II-fold pyridoxal phosphate-dependent enzyme, partial [Candidatus Margulisbacteria bacterium]|nr:aminotransferase class I/II-fold pyridoxal phosphate-dependent enzyme [Candidatus Margulisiibacteriota bacterium]
AFQHNTLLLIDEAYYYYYLETFIKYVLDFDNIIILRTFSKLCGLAASRIGYAAANSSIIKNMKRVKPTFDVSGLGVLFASYLMDNTHFISREIERFRVGRKYITDLLGKDGVEYKIGQGNFMLIKCPENANKIVEELLKDNILVKGNFSQPILKDYFRITLGSEKYMKRFYNSFRKIR